MKKSVKKTRHGDSVHIPGLDETLNDIRAYSSRMREKAKQTTGKVKLSRDGKMDAYEMAISYLRGEECSYDPDGDYRLARHWLANKLDRELTSWLQQTKPKDGND